MVDRQQTDDLLVIRGVTKHYPVSRGLWGRKSGSIKAVDGIDLSIHRSETLGLVGESGCGKSTLGRLILRLEEPTSGQIFFEGHDLLALRRRELHAVRRRMQIVFQDPYSSLNPRQSVGRIIGEGLVIHGVGTLTERTERVRELMEFVGLHPEDFHRYPHELSGGQRQRIGIARALALNPDFIICDEPLSALDVSIQAQIINLLEDVREQFQLTTLFISHDLSVVRHISDRVAVMYLGRLVELASTEELFSRAGHPYTQTLLSAIPSLDPREHRRARANPREPADPIKGFMGCNFLDRCPRRTADCEREVPPLEELSRHHWIRCFQK